MVKKSKRKQDIRSKLVAAVAMLMVATIMMVSSTYAWFTLSTAPEVQGITTTVGSNGSLEIALSPASGLAADVSDANLQTGTEWTEKNLTWGNLLDLSDSSYNLGDLMLLPAQLVADTKAGGGYTLTASPLATPSYGSDGRIQGLLKNTMIGGLREGSAGYYEGGSFGVRGVGTSDNMSEQALAYKTNLAAIKSHANKAAAAAGKSLDDNGSALASIMVRYASETGSNYAEFVPALQALTADLNTSVTELGEMMRAALIVAATPISDVNTFNTVRAAIESATVIDTTLISQVTTAGGTVPAGFTEAASKVAAVAQKVLAAKTAADNLDATGTVVWGDVSAIMTNLMNTTGNITVGGFTLGEIKEEKDNLQFLLDLATNCQIVLGANSGVYYDIAEISGNFDATVTATLTGTFDGQEQTVTIRDAVIRTNYTGTTAADTLYAGANNVTASGDNANKVINVNYGYIVDFMFRTNASGSNLLLQTEGTQRVYADSQNPATAGKGSVFTFTTTDASRVESIEGLVESIYVVFFAPDSSDIYGVAGVTEVETVEANGTYTITGTLELCAIDVADTGYVTVGNANGTNTLCALGQNQVKAVSAMVYLDGNNVTNADVLNDTNVTGALNLQFASSVDLVPMENTALRTEGTEVKYDAVLKVGAAEIETVEDAVTAGATYSVDLDDELTTDQIAKIYTITVKMGGTEVQGAYNDTEHTITVTNVTGDIEVIVTLTDAGNA